MKVNLVWAGLMSAAAWLGTSERANAGIEACGDIHVEADAQCRVEVEGGCEARCTPLTVEAACAGELEIECRGECDLDAEASCTATCNVATCVAQCDIDPPRFECSAECSAQAEATCAGECQADADRSQCEASCKATYSASCDASCSRTPGSASCQGKCEARCEADCSAKANIDCQVDCQRRGSIECKTRVEGGCEAACTRPEGALFCDGQYVDHGGNLEECISAIEAAIDIRVQTRGSADGECSGNGCYGTAEGAATASCSLGERPGADTSAGGALFGLIALAGLAGVRSRRGRRRRGCERARLTPPGASSPSAFRLPAPGRPSRLG